MAPYMTAFLLEALWTSIMSLLRIQSRQSWSRTSAVIRAEPVPVSRKVMIRCVRDECNAIGWESLYFFLLRIETSPVSWKTRTP